MKGWRTVIFNTVTIFVTGAGIVLQYLDRLGLSDEAAAFIGMTISIAVAMSNIYLRSITTTPMGKKL